jgi:hypothetical protein
MNEIPAVSFLACYDYGQGGVWLILDAPTCAAAQAAFPKLKVFESRPSWMSDLEEAEYRSRCQQSGFRWNIDSPSGWLLEHMAEYK